ncbi:hypothetical protein I308_106643 [Cryptococcus tetragattii IND107]|uniref:Uncharacterized protein n=1 Tax=Cryptococcus tetragattii IND107 TaxID=1296105 RepID=A0ABR3BIV6_9TREE|nr:hypothetical protein I308_06567 [Cryptococcus tetragattii IND107]
MHCIASDYEVVTLATVTPNLASMSLTHTCTNRNPLASTDCPIHVPPTVHQDHPGESHRSRTGIWFPSPSGGWYRPNRRRD